MPTLGRGYQSKLIQSNFAIQARALIAGQPMIIGQYTVNAKEAISLGKGQHSALDQAEGRAYMDLKSGASTNIEGMVRISVYTPQMREKMILAEWRTEALRQTSKRDQEPLPEMREVVTEDDIIVISVIADANATVSVADTKLSFDIVRYEVQ